jgi:hypothetical protein
MDEGNTRGGVREEDAVIHALSIFPARSALSMHWNVISRFPTKLFSQLRIVEVVPEANGSSGTDLKDCSSRIVLRS